jgi:ribosomal protein S18 acetylase RimI-like enzyme
MRRSMSRADHALRVATPDDAESMAALAIQVFLDTYATDGVRRDLAREALTLCSPAAFTRLLADPARLIVLAERDSHLLGFAEVSHDLLQATPAAPTGHELARLYVQPAFQGAGVGSSVLAHVESRSRAAEAPCIWLTAWSGNLRARRFYHSKGYEDVGATDYTFAGKSYENRILVKPCRG